jgi:hypothetical protein
MRPTQISAEESPHPPGTLVLPDSNESETSDSDDGESEIDQINSSPSPAEHSSLPFTPVRHPPTVVERLSSPFSPRRSPTVTVTYTKCDRARVLGERAQAAPEKVHEDHEMLSSASEEASNDDNNMLSPMRVEASDDEDDELLSPAPEEGPIDYLLSPHHSHRISDIYEGTVSHHAALKSEGNAIHEWTNE